ncbi:hypothetical protein [Enterovibrio sp. 27052020O]|uniref:hypothetical protein n=1 Tax=Enterovibrio sp. 27052020O TaxID=3241166 RepID=UPI003890DE51
MFRSFYRRFWVLFSIGLMLLNVATVLNAKVYDLMHGAFSSLPFSSIVSKSKATQLASLKKENIKLARNNSEYELLKKSRKSRALKAKTISKRISRRVVRNITLNTSSVVGQSIPYLGVAAILSVTAADIYDGCQTVKDTNELLQLFDEVPDVEKEDEICGVTLPTIEEIQYSFSNYQEDTLSTLSEYFQ